MWSGFAYVLALNQSHRVLWVCPTRLVKTYYDLVSTNQVSRFWGSGFHICFSLVLTIQDLTSTRQPRLSLGQPPKPTPVLGQGPKPRLSLDQPRPSLSQPCLVLASPKTLAEPRHYASLGQGPKSRLGLDQPWLTLRQIKYRLWDWPKIVWDELWSWYHQKSLFVYVWAKISLIVGMRSAFYFFSYLLHWLGRLRQLGLSFYNTSISKAMPYLSGLCTI